MTCKPGFYNVCAFTWGHLYRRYRAVVAKNARDFAKVAAIFEEMCEQYPEDQGGGLVQVELSLTHSLKPPGSNP
jgi:hypothetical protein